MLSIPVYYSPVVRIEPVTMENILESNAVFENLSFAWEKTMEVKGVIKKKEKQAKIESNIIQGMIVFLEAQGTNAYNRYAMCPAGQFRVNFWVMFLFS